MTLIGAQFDADLINISEVTSRKTKWPRFFGLPCRWLCFQFVSQSVCSQDDSESFGRIFDYFWERWEVRLA